MFDFGDFVDGVHLIVDGEFELVTKVQVQPSQTFLKLNHLARKVMVTEHKAFH